MDKPAFPRIVPKYVDASYIEGLSRRELFAAMAMQGLIADCQPSRIVQNGPCSGKSEAQVCAEDAVKCADALIAELDKTDDD